MKEIKDHRLLSLDILRGLTIILMIIVNTPGSWSYVYPPLLHAEWNGITPTDYIFPTFLFIVGVSIVLSFTKQIEIGKSKVDMTKKTLIRALKIYGVGIFCGFGLILTLMKFVGWVYFIVYLLFFSLCTFIFVYL